MIHAKAYSPRTYPWNGSVSPAQIDRAQDISKSGTLNRDKTYEIGRDGVLGYNQKTPNVSYTLRQYEYGNMAFYRQLANVAAPASAGLDNYLTLDDFKTTIFDITADLTDDAGTFTGTLWYPKLRLSGFSINIGDPEAIVERTFNIVGEDDIILDGKYFSLEQVTCVGAGTEDITLNPAAVEWASGDYVFRVLRVRSGVCTELVEDTTSAYADNTWRYSAGHVYVQDCLIDDVVKVYYPSSTADSTHWTDNDSDPDFLRADSCDIFIKSGVSTQVYRLQSVGVDVTFERTDYREIGNAEIVQTGVKSKNVSIKLGRLLEGFSIEDVLAGDTAYPYIKARNFAQNLQVMIKVYEDNTKTTFKIGYLITEASPTNMDNSQTIEDYDKQDITLEATNLKVSDDESEIAFN